MISVDEALEVRRIVRDTFERGEIAHALWLANQHARELAIADSFVSLTEPVGGLLEWRVGLHRALPWFAARARAARQNRDALRAAVAAAAAGGGGVIHIPAGTWHLRGAVDFGGATNVLITGIDDDT